MLSCFSVASTVCNPMDCSLSDSPVRWILRKSTGVGYSALLQGIFLSQGSNLHLLCLYTAGGFFYH